MKVIHIYVALIVLVLIFMFNSTYAGVTEGVVKSILEILKLISGVVLVVCLYLISCITEQKDISFKSIPFTSIENSANISIDTSAVMILSQVSGMQIHEDFILTDDLRSDKLDTWLNSRYGSIVIYVKKGSDVLYTKPLERVDKKASTEVLDYYNQWKTEGTLPRQNVRYKFLCFYMDV